IGSVKVLLVSGCGLMPKIGVLLFVISFEAKRKVPSPPIVITKSAQSTHLASPILYSITDKLYLLNLTINSLNCIGRKLFYLLISRMCNEHGIFKAMNHGAGSWSELDGLKTLNTEVFNQLSVIRQRIETSRHPPRLFCTEISYRGSVPSWSSRSLTLRSFLAVTSCDSTRLQPCQFLALYLVIIVVCRATPVLKNVSQNLNTKLNHKEITDSTNNKINNKKIISEKFKKINTNIAYKPINKLNNIIKTGKDKINKIDNTNVIYRMNCLDCGKKGETTEWHFESFSFLKPKFAFESAMEQASASRESPHLGLPPGKRTVISSVQLRQSEVWRLGNAKFRVPILRWRSQVRADTRARNGRRRNNLRFTSDTDFPIHPPFYYNSIETPSGF
ncbi:hypothetical protein ALC62_13110, partial [Cyphomyrmex costatus]